MMTRWLIVLSLFTLWAALSPAPARATAPSPQKFTVRILRLHHARADAMFGALPRDPATHAIQLPAGVTHLYALERDNTLLVFANADGFARIKDIAQRLDAAPQGVTLPPTPGPGR